jgi:arylsulfatase A-like enzyme
LLLLSGRGWNPGARPNILFISIDTLRADHLGCYGYQRPTSPHFDRLAAEGVRFARAVAPSSFTLPSHVSMFTGQEMGVHHVASAGTAIADRVVTITEVLHDAGYATFGFGCAPYLKRQFGFAQGFDFYDDRLANVGVRESHAAVTSDKVVNRALQRIKEPRGKPWFVFMHMWDPHFDYVPPPPYNTMFSGDYHGGFSMHNFEQNHGFVVGMDPADYAYTVSQYDGEIAWTDSQLGRLFDALKKMGLWEKTAIVLTADHGEEFLDHGQRGHGHSLYDELVHVPLIVKLPGAASHKVIDCAVSLIDLYPTLAELAGVRRSGYRGDGRSLLELIFGRGQCDANRMLVSETNLSRIDKAHDSPHGYEMAIEVGGVKFFHRFKEPLREMMFDLRVDPREEHDLMAARPQQAAALRNQLYHQHQQMNVRAE